MFPTLPLQISESCLSQGCLLPVLAQRTSDLERWQTAQNGSLQRLEQKLDRLLAWMMGSLFTAVLALGGISFTLLRMK